jgi:hypothetical protein
MTIDDTASLPDDELLAEVRSECLRWEGRDELEAGFARLFHLRDEACAAGCPCRCPIRWRRRRQWIRRAIPSWTAP